MFQLSQTEKAAKIIESSINLKSLSPSQSKCQILLQLSAYFGCLRRYERQFLCLQRAIKIAEEQDYKFYISFGYLSLGTFYKILENYESAVTYLAFAEDLTRKTGKTKVLSSCLQLAGESLVKLEKYREAIEKFEEAFRVCPIKENLLSHYIALGDTYSSLSLDDKDLNKDENFKNAKMYFELGQKLAGEQGDRENTFECISHLAKLHVDHKLFDEALVYLKAAEFRADTCENKYIIFQHYAENLINKYMQNYESAERRGDHSSLVCKEAENWLEKAEDYYNEMWAGLEQDFDKIIWSNRGKCVLLTRRIQFVKWLLDKKLEALIVSERFRARSLRDCIHRRQPTGQNMPNQ